MSTKRLATIDCETDPFKFGRVPKPFAWGIEYDNGEFHYFWGDDCTEQLIQYLVGESDLILYAHNGGKFDFFFLLSYLDNDLFIINGRIAKATLFDGAIEIRDSFLIIPVPLAEHDKIEIDYNKFEREERDNHKNEIIRYLKRDCSALLELIMYFWETFGDKLTIASTAFMEIKKTGYVVSNTTESFDNLFRHFYFGGRVQCFKTGAFVEPLKYVDINSAYPASMKYNHWYGPGYNERSTLPDIENGSWYAEIQAVAFDCLPCRGDDNKLYFPNDGISRRYYASGWEIQAGLDTGSLKIEKVYCVFTPKQTMSFSEYVDKYYAQKLHAKETKDPIMELFAKILLNSGYGKFAQDGRDFKKFMLLEFGEKPDLCEGWKFHADTDFNSTIWEKPDPLYRFFNVATAASITAHVRSFLFRNIHESDNVLYCDTDSLICSKFNGAISKQLGEWSLEADIEEAYIAQRKMYALLTSDGKHKVASKGVRLNFDQIKNGVLKGEEILTEREAPAFSLKYGARFLDRKTNFTNLQKNALNNPPN